MPKINQVEQPEALTSRKYQVAALVCRGLPNKQIARELSLCEGTVKQHVHNIFHKLRIRNRCALIAFFEAEQTATAPHHQPRSLVTLTPEKKLRR